jgi:hypothetical protein
MDLIMSLLLIFYVCIVSPRHNDQAVLIIASSPARTLDLAVAVYSRHGSMRLAYFILYM